MIFTNPKIDGTVTSVEDLIDGIKRDKPKKYTVHGTVPIPSWSGFTKHFQGIAPYNNTLETSIGFISASASEGYVACFTEVDGQLQVRSLITPDPNYYHAAGVQLLGDFLVIPLESSSKDKDGLLMFYDISNPAAPIARQSVHTPGRKSSAAGITRYTESEGDWCMLVDYEYDHHQMYVWRAPASLVERYPAAWTFMQTYLGKAFDTGDQYQCFALVTQANPGGDVVYLLGFREDEEIWLYRLDTTASGYGNPTKVQKYTKWNGTDFRYGTGLQIVSPTQLRIFGTSEQPSGSEKNYKFNYYVYGT